MADKIYQVNLEELISNYVWNRFKNNQNFFKKLFLKRSDYQFDIRWGYVEFTHVTNPKENNAAGKKEDKAKPQTKQAGVAQTSEIQNAVQQLKPEPAEAKKKDVELYFSEYENKTLTTQVYKFSTARQTTETTRFEMQENYTIGAQTNLSVNLGEIVSFGTEISGSFSVTETKAQEYSKSLTWNIDTEIKVPAWNKAKAILYVYEMGSSSNFVVKTTMRLPTGNLPVSIIRVKDGKEVFVGWILNLAVLFDDAYKNRSTVKVLEENVEIKGRPKILSIVELTTRGICRHVGFKNQHVEVECKLMDNAPADLHQDSDDK